MYYLESEQTPSLCALGTLVGENIIASGGILIQAMPDCSEELLDALEIRAELVQLDFSAPFRNDAGGDR